MKARDLSILTMGLLSAGLMLLAGGCSGNAAGPKPQATPEAAPSSAGTEDAVDLAVLARGKEAYMSCGMCHCETDPQIEWDADWVKLNEETTCIGGGAPEPEVRRSIMAYLLHPETLRPLLVDRNFKPTGGMKTGEISVPANSGSAYLKASRGSIKAGTPPMVRLYWEDSKDEKSMTAPAGDYTVINYWLYKLGGEKGEDRWSASVTNVDGCANLVIAPGADCWFITDPVLRADFTAEKTEKGALLSFALFDMGGNRASLTCNGRMVFPKYEIIGEDDGVVGGARFEVT